LTLVRSVSSPLSSNGACGSFRTRFTDALHRRCLAGASKAYCGDPNPSSLRMRDDYVWVLKPSAGTGRHVTQDLLATIAFNLMRAAGAAASPRHAHARWATLRSHLIAVPARIATSTDRAPLGNADASPERGRQAWKS